VDLRLHDKIRCVQRCSYLFCLLRGFGRSTLSGCDVESFKELFCLVFMNIHLSGEFPTDTFEQRAEPAYGVVGITVKAF
jgi:hypothetical protein